MAGKRLKAQLAKVDRMKNYPLDEALKILKGTASAKFDESVDVAINLGIDAKKSDQNVRGTAVMPRGTGKKVRIAVFAEGNAAEAAKKAGADIVGFQDLADQIKAGKIEFDLARLDLVREILETDDVGTGLFRGLGGVAFGEHRDAHLLAGAARHHRRAADILVRFLGVDAEVDRDVHRFVELGAGGTLENLQGFVERIILHAIDFGELGFQAFTGHITPPRIPRPSGVRCPR